MDVEDDFTDKQLSYWYAQGKMLSPENVRLLISNYRALRDALTVEREALILAAEAHKAQRLVIADLAIALKTANERIEKLENDLQLVSVLGVDGSD